MNSYIVHKSKDNIVTKLLIKSFCRCVLNNNLVPIVEFINDLVGASMLNEPILNGFVLKPYLPYHYPLGYAVGLGAVNIVEYILDSGGGIDFALVNYVMEAIKALDNPNPCISLRMSGDTYRKNMYRIIGMLLRCGADANRCDSHYNNHNPLSLAVTRNNYILVKLLADNGVDMNPVLVYGLRGGRSTILDYATCYEVAKLLLNEGTYPIVPTINNSFKLKHIIEECVFKIKGFILEHVPNVLCGIVIDYFC